MDARLGFWCSWKEEDSRCIPYSVSGSSEKIFEANLSWYKQLLVASNCLYCSICKLGLYLLSRWCKYEINSGKTIESKILFSLIKHIKYHLF